MLTETLFYSLEQMRLVKPIGDAVVVSILDRSEAAGRPLFSGYRDALRLGFEDTAEEYKLAEAGAWPDNPTDAEHERFAQGKGERVPTLRDAQEIVAFLRKHRSSAEQLKLLVHCKAGISRSAAVAAWAAAAMWIPLGTSRSTAYANPRVLRLLDKAFERI